MILTNVACYQRSVCSNLSMYQRICVFMSPHLPAVLLKAKSMHVICHNGMYRVYFSKVLIRSDRNIFGSGLLASRGDSSETIIPLFNLIASGISSTPYSNIARMSEYDEGNTEGYSMQELRNVS